MEASTIEVGGDGKKRMMVIVLVMIRVVVMIWWSFGYIHPDEFFQSGYELWYGYRLPPWEFQQQIRSIVPPTLMTRLPIRLLQHVLPTSNTTTALLLQAPRLWMGIISFLCFDAFLLRRNNNDSHGGSRILWCSLWTTLVFFHRTFTNVMESWYVAIVIHLLSTTTSSNQSHVLLGIVCSLGINCRFTFVIFVAPAILYHFIQLLYSKQEKQQKLKQLVGTMLGFIVTTIVWIHLDSNYYNNKSNTTDIVITPWNAFQYNRHASNLEEHGLHPHYLHIMVNMPLLYGPLAIYFYYRELLLVVSSKQTTITKNNTNKVYHRIVLWSGLIGISLAPHQEPRFILPLAFPLVQLYGNDLYQILTHQLPIKILYYIWTISLFLWFSVLHQGALLPSLLALSQQYTSQSTPPPQSIIYYHTYMPPTFLLLQQQSSKPTYIQVTNPPISSAVCPAPKPTNNKKKITYFYDLTSSHSTMETLYTTLQHVVYSSSKEQQQQQQQQQRPIYVVAPDTSINTTSTIDINYKWTPIWSQFQINMEELPPITKHTFLHPSTFHLVIWRVEPLN